MKEWSGRSHLKMTQDQRRFITLLERDGLIENQAQLIELALAIGLREGLGRSLDSYNSATYDIGPIGTFDPDGTLVEAILHKYGNLDEGAAFGRVTEHILAGIDRIQEHYLEHEGLDMGRLLALR